MNENFILSSVPIEVSEFTNHKEATFLISVLDEYNLNNVMIEKDEGEKYHKTIVGYPIVAYLQYDKDGKPDDFGGHEVRAKYNSETKEVEYYFATYPIGSVTESWIEEREVDGYEGLKNVILIKTKLWKSRLPEYFKVFDKLWDTGKISSSWEISSSESTKTTKGKILKTFEFIGNCLLGNSVTPAVKGAGALEVASENVLNYELSNAFIKDIQTLKQEEIENEISQLDDKSINDINKNEGGNDYMSEKLQGETPIVSSMTDNDLYTKVRKAVNATDTNKWFYVARMYPYEYRAVAYEWDRESEDDYVEFNYSVNSDETISINSQKEVKMMFVPKSDYEAEISTLKAENEKLTTDLSEKTEAILKAGEKIEELTSSISELTPFKEKVEAIEKAEKDAEIEQKKTDLKTLATKGGYISQEEIETSEEIKGFIEALDIASIKGIIADRVIEKLTKEEQSPVVETSQTEVTNKETKNIKTNINEDDSVDYKSAMNSYLKI